MIADVGTEPARGNHYLFPLSGGAEGSWQFEKVEGFLKGDGFDALSLFQGGKAGFYIAVGIPYLDHRAITTDFHVHVVPRFRVFSKGFFAAHFTGCFEGFFDLFVKGSVKLTDHLVPYLFAFGDIVEIFLHIGSKIIVEDIGKMVHQEIVDQHTDIGWKKFGFFVAGIFRFYRFGYLVIFQGDQGIVAGNARAVFFHHVFSFLDRGDGRGVGGGASDAQFFQFFNQGCLGVTERLLGEFLLGVHFGQHGLVAGVEWREGSFFAILFFFIF